MTKYQENLDVIEIENLEIYAYHGALDEEKRLGQRFFISTRLFLDLRDASRSDDLNDTIDYSKVCAEIKHIFTKDKYNLIESVGEKIANFILEKYHSVVRSIELQLKKPNAPIAETFSSVSVKINRMWHNAYIAIGSNLGDRQKYISDSIELLKTRKTIIHKVSSIYETDPVGIKTKNKFLNAVALVETSYSPKELMRFLLGVEKELGRVRHNVLESRTIDLDVLLYDDLILSYQEITIPHPHMHSRMFVIEPLCEIAPYEVHPVIRKRIFEIKQDLIQSRH